MDNPLVSILMPCFNHEKYIAVAINSVLEQTYKNIELIIIDDGSSDRTWAEIVKFKDHPNITVQRQKNVGLIETLKILRKMANGEYITILASDDRFYPWKIEVMIDEFRRQPDIIFCTGKTDIIDQNGNVIGNIVGEYDGEDDLYNRLINGRTYVSSVSTIVKSAAYKAVDFFDPYIEDLPAWIQISGAGKTTTVGRIVASYRRTSGSLSCNISKMIDSEMRIIKHYCNNNDVKKLPAGWCGRWFKAYAGIDAYKAINFLASECCNIKIIFEKDFYKGIIKLITKRAL